VRVSVPVSKLSIWMKFKMHIGTRPQKLLATILGLLLASCSVTQHQVPGPSSSRDLTRYVLVIEKTPDGQATHSWKPLGSVELSKYQNRTSNYSVGGHFVRAVQYRDCEREFDDCIKMCVKSLRGRSWSHATKASKIATCRTRCYPAYLDCSRLQEQSPRETVRFTEIDEAIDWLKDNSEMVLAGTVVVIAGVTFAVVVGGTGGAALLLAPAVIFASSTDDTSSPRVAAVKP